MLSPTGKWPLAVRAREFLGIELVDPAEAAELALDAVVEAVMIAVARDEAVAADAVVGLDALDDVDRERQPRDPGRAGRLVGEIELGRGRVVDPGLGAEIVDDCDRADAASART